MKGKRRLGCVRDGSQGQSLVEIDAESRGFRARIGPRSIDQLKHVLLERSGLAVAVEDGLCLQNFTNAKNICQRDVAVGVQHIAQTAHGDGLDVGQWLGF